MFKIIFLLFIMLSAEVSAASYYEPKSSIVSAARVGKNAVIIVDYNKMTLIQEMGGRWLENKIEITGGEAPKYPTGVFFDSARELLYVANYHHDNVIVLKKVSDSHFHVFAVISSEHTISPENVSVSPDGIMVAIANYDGGNVSVFKKFGDKYLFIYKIDLRQAHGVTTDSQYLFATGLENKRFIKADLSTGNIVASSGKKGRDPEKGEFLWPTSVLFLNGHLYLIDAHLSKLCLIDQLILVASECVGTQGNQRFEFNMPYGLVAFDTNVGVVDPFRSAITFFSSDLKFKEKPFIGKKDRNLKPSSNESYQNRLVKDGASPYHLKCILPEIFRGFLCDYNGISSQDHLLQISMGGRPGNLTSANFYLLDATLLTDDNYVFFSPQSQFVIALNTSSKPSLSFFTLPIANHYSRDIKQFLSEPVNKNGRNLSRLNRSQYHFRSAVTSSTKTLQDLAEVIGLPSVSTLQELLSDYGDFSESKKISEVQDIVPLAALCNASRKSLEVSQTARVENFEKVILPIIIHGKMCDEL